MGAPKQKWTPQEEAALKGGVLKHGAGKWRTILKDPLFSSVLQLRSNVDLKDKWRNMSVVANWGSREKAKLALKRMKQVPKQDEISMAFQSEVQTDEGIVHAKPVSLSTSSPQTGASKRSIIRLDNLIMEAINSLEEPGGSNKTTIGTYIEEQYWAPPNFKRLLSAKLKYLTARGKLFKMKRKYRIAPASSSSSSLKSEGRRYSSMIVRGDDEVDAEVAKMRRMSPQEAASVAAKAVAEAEAAIAEAEEAAKAADVAEAEAEAAQAFAEAAIMTFKAENTPGLMVRV